MMMWEKNPKVAYACLRSEWKFESLGMKPLCHFKTYKKCQHDRASSTGTFQPPFLFEYLHVRWL